MWQAQLSDSVLCTVIQKVADSTLPNMPVSSDSENDLNRYTWEHFNLQLQQGVLYWKAVGVGLIAEAILQLVMPTDFCENACQGCHDIVGHMVINKALDLLRDRLYWLSIAEYTTIYISHCKCYLSINSNKCLCSLAHPHTVWIIAYYLCLRPTKISEEKVLLVTDHYT